MNGHSGIDAVEATEHLKNILNVGKSETESVKLKPVLNGNMEAAGEASLVLKTQPYQKIELCADEDASHNSIYGTEVDIYSSPMVYGTTCSQIIVEHMVDYGWEEKYYYGKQIAIHINGKYLAYVLKPVNKKPGFVRILRLRLNWRYLIKDYTNEIKDIAFAHSSSQVLFGSVDACGELSVYHITEDGDSLSCNLFLRVLRPSDWQLSGYNRIIWCSFIPDDTEDECTEEDVASLLVVTHNERAEIWNVHIVTKEHGHGNIAVDEVNAGVQVISEHKSPISTATFSPDGSALAIGSIDGIVKFYQVSAPLEKDISPRCLHQWTPHGEKALSSLYFLDNHKNYRPDVQFWKYAITGADNNTEIKVWSCETWVCLQKIRLHSNSEDCIQPCLTAEMDLSSKYLLLSDIKRKVLLVLLIHQEPLETTAYIKSISEFRVPLPILCIAISSIICVKFPPVSDGENSEEEESEAVGDSFVDGEENRNKLTMKLFWIQPKSLQSCHITFTPKLESPLRSIGSISSLSQESFGFKDGLSDISLDAKETSNRSVRELDISLQNDLCVNKLGVTSQSSVSNLTSLNSHKNYSNCSEVLLTPDDFTSPSHNLTAPSSFAHHEEVKPAVSKRDCSTRLSDGIDSLPVEPSTLVRRKSSQHSATSSPSREVAEIMAPTKGLHLDEIVLETPNLKIKDDVEKLASSLNSFAISAAPISSTSQPDFHMNEWPQVPDPNKEYKLPSRNENDINSHNNCFLSNNETSPTVKFDAESNRVVYQLNQKFEEVLTKIEALTELSSNQRHEIKSLQNEIKTLQDQKHNQLSTNLSNKLDHVISQHLVPGYSRIESLILKTAEDEKKQSERDLTILSADISSTFGSRLDNTLKQELASCILPQINRVLDTVAQKMQLDFSQKLGATDVSVRETFNKHLKGKAFVDSLAQSIVSSLQSIIQSTCKEVFQLNVIPAFEKSCQHLFHQLNELFQKGTVDYIQILEKNGMSSCSMLEHTASQLKEEIHSLVSSTQKALHNHATQLEKREQDIIKQQEILLSSMRLVVQEELRRAFRDQTAVLNSRSVTPVPHNDPMLQKQQLMHLVKQGNIDEAFQTALSAMDVQLVMFLCESISVDQVFGTIPCPLQQHVLLSLVNQLSADLSVKTEIKIRYIEDVIASLDNTDPIIKDHIQNVLENLQQRIATFLQKYPNHKFSRNMKRISLAIQSLIHC